MCSKYLVYKNDSGIPGELVEDAVVIRRQDVFAPPALDAYANAIQCAIELLAKDASEPHTFETMGRLQIIADHFHDQAAKAWTEPRKIPD